MYKETATSVLGFRKKRDKQWITPETWTKIDERRKVKDNLLNTKSPRLTERTKEEYKIKDKEVRRIACGDKKAFLEELTCEAETAAAKGDLITVYKINKQVSGQNNTCNKPVKDKQGKLLIRKGNRLNDGLSILKNSKCLTGMHEPNEPADPDPSDDIDINLSPPSQAEMETAVKAMKGGKVPGIDSLQAELLKADITTASMVFTDLFAKIWNQEIIPKGWSKGIIYTIPKKGVPSNCDNFCLFPARSSAESSSKGSIVP